MTFQFTWLIDYTDLSWYTDKTCYMLYRNSMGYKKLCIPIYRLLLIHRNPCIQIFNGILKNVYTSIQKFLSLQKCLYMVYCKLSCSGIQKNMYIRKTCIPHIQIILDTQKTMYTKYTEKCVYLQIYLLVYRYFCPSETTVICHHLADSPPPPWAMTSFLNGP